ncbi:RNA metabolism protein [Lithospermum erythrorhizon]|uniref:RNA metabolism protein n=1 Tax=Lithospermum erythrorhizon TaxID=34254 RepID=A0AAV3QCU2_LITER
MASHHEVMVPGNGSRGSVWPIMSNYSPFSDRNLSKLFVGGLAWETKSESLHRYFEQFGEIEEAVVIYDRTSGRSKGYGFVTFKDQEAARRACENPNPVIDSREANCNIASLGRRHQPLLSSPYGVMVPTSPRSPVIGSPHAGSSLYQLPLNYGYQPGYYYPSFRPMIYGPGYMYPQPQVYVPPSSKKLPDDPITQRMPYGHASGGGFFLTSPNAMHSTGPGFGEALQYSSGSFAPPLRTPLALAMAPLETRHHVTNDSSSDEPA